MAFARLGTKLGGALGNVERTEYDTKIRDGVTRMEVAKDQMEKILDKINDVTPSVGGLTKNEKLAQTLKQTVSIYGDKSKAAPTFSSLAEALTRMGQEDRQLEKRQSEFVKAPIDNFLKEVHPTFTREKNILDTKTLDMDGARNENRKKPTEETGTKEKETTAIFNQQVRTMEALIGQIPTHYNVQAGAMKAFAQLRGEYHANCAAALKVALTSMTV